MSNNKEIWKDIEGYEGLYMVSDLGRVRSLNRTISVKNHKRFIKGRILKQRPNAKGYLGVVLYKKNGDKKNFYVAKLVAMAFLNHKPCGMKRQVDHINKNIKDNRLINLQVLSSIEHSHKDNVLGKSKYRGVSWIVKNKKWMAKISINRIQKYIGSYDSEYEAHLAYQKELKKIINENNN